MSVRKQVESDGEKHVARLHTQRKEKLQGFNDHLRNLSKKITPARERQG